MTSPPKNLLDRAQLWPEQAREELIRVADEIESELAGSIMPRQRSFGALIAGFAPWRRATLLRQRKLPLFLAIKIVSVSRPESPTSLLVWAAPRYRVPMEKGS